MPNACTDREPNTCAVSIANGSADAKPFSSPDTKPHHFSYPVAIVSPDPGSRRLQGIVVVGLDVEGPRGLQHAMGQRCPVEIEESASYQ